MQLVLEACGDANGMSHSMARKEFDGVGGVIGRGSACDWVIPDTSRVLSSHHGLVSYRDGQYFLTDISSNGIGLAGSAERLRKGQAYPISDGNVFMLGTLAMRARLVDAESSAAIPDDAFLGLDTLHTPDEAPPSWTEPRAPEWEHLVTPTLVDAAPQVATPQANTPHANPLFWSHFAHALGIDLDGFDTPGREALAIKVASLFRHTLDHLQQCLRTREALTREWGLEPVRDALKSHNPLQDNATLEATLEALLGDGALGQLSAHRAIAEVFRDIQAHQVAMLVACRSAVRGARQAFAPSHLQRGFERHHKPPRLFADGAHWRAYQRHYQQLIDDESPGEPHLGRDFVAAYTEQVRLIATLHAASPG